MVYYGRSKSGGGATVSLTAGGCTMGRIWREGRQRLWWLEDVLGSEKCGAHWAEGPQCL